jgi:hypothetical protein
MLCTMTVRSTVIDVSLISFLTVMSMVFAFTHYEERPALSPQTDSVMVRYERAKDKLTRMTSERGEVLALQEFRHMIDVDPELSNLCHPLAHEVGHAAYAHDGLKALDANDDICGSGYMHGIIESHFLNVDDIRTELKQTCEPDAGKCFHGLGHGLMYASSGDVPGSLRLCDTLELSSQRHQCFEGVFMELFETDLRSHPTTYLSLKNPFYPCNTYKGSLRSVCAFYAPRWYLRLNAGEYAQSLEWCFLQKAGAVECVRGVGSVAMKDHMAVPLLAHDICMSARSSVRQSCVAGMVSYYIVHFASAAKGKELCTLLPDTDVRTCEQVVRDSERYYPAQK